MTLRKWKKKILLLCLITGFSPLVVFINVTKTAAAVRYAKSGGRGNCTSWAEACSLNTALTGAGSGDEIWVKTGVHYPVTTGLSDPRTATFVLKYRVALYGGFNGTETNRNQRNWKTNPTVLSGDIDHNDENGDGNNISETVEGIAGNNAYHVVTGVDQATLDGFIITAGMADGSDNDDRRGGGMNNAGDQNSTPDNYIHPTITNCTFIGNFASTAGGGMYNFHSRVTVTESTFNHNESGSSGGGVDNFASTPTITSCTFSFNETGYNGGGDGGGMENYYSEAIVENCIFRNNNAESGKGGGLLNYDSGSRVSSCTFSYNTADEGGGMFNMSNVENPTISKCIFSYNRAGRFGGGMENYRGQPIVVNCIFRRNKAAVSGAGMYNTAASRPQVTNCTFTNNTHWGMYNANHSDPILQNIILWNTVMAGNQIDNDGSSNPVISYSDIQGCISAGGSWNSTCGTDGGHNMAVDPRFLNETNGNLHLVSDSPAINTGICGEYVPTPTIHYERIAPYDDMDGDKRPGDGKIFGCDIGADEYKPFPWPMFLPAMVNH